MLVSERLKNLWDHLKADSTKLPSHFAIPRQRVLPDKGEAEAFTADKHYFQVRINQMFLRDQRKWFSKVDPLVVIATEFTYDKSEQAVPFVVGPQLLEKYGNMMQVPTGMIFSNTRVAGIHPYRGGRLVISIVLCQIERENFAKHLLNIVEKVAGALDFATALTSYVKLSGVILDGIESLMGFDTTKALIGMREEFDPQAGDEFKPSYFALIDVPSGQVNPNQLWVDNGELKQGSTKESLSEFRDGDYVLFSIVQSIERSDVRTLPFYPMFERAKQEAASPETDSWQRAKANLSTLYQTLVLTPDLIPNQADALNSNFVDEVKRIRQVALQNAALGEKSTHPLEDSRLRKAAEVLDL